MVWWKSIVYHLAFHESKPEAARSEYENRDEEWSAQMKEKVVKEEVEEEEEEERGMVN